MKELKRTVDGYYCPHCNRQYPHHSQVNGRLCPIYQARLEVSAALAAAFEGRGTK